MRTSTVNNLLIAAFYAAALILGMILGPKFARENDNTKNGSFIPFFGAGRTEKVEKILQIINDKYVDSVKTDSLQLLAISEILNRLDPHSTYLPPSEANSMNEDLDGSFNGIGIEYQIVNDTLLITAINDNGPAEATGIKAGDQILEIGRTNIATKGITEKKVVDMIRGRRGSKIEVAVKRPGEFDKKIFFVTRDKITISSIDVAYMLNNKTGYIRISRFGSRTDTDFLDALEKLAKQDMQSLVLDLRENRGGYLNAATAIADHFLSDKKLIVYTQGLHEPRTNYFATDAGKFEKGKLVVLVDENSASASEIVAGAVQDLDRGIIIGRRSFGKGLVQEQFNFGDGSTMNLTVARYYTPSGRSIQKPYKKGYNNYNQEINERFLKGELISGETHFSDSVFDKNKVYKTSTGRLMYGGGGIMPDIYVPVDTSGRTGFYYELNAKGVLEKYLFNELIKEIGPAEAKDLTDSFKLNDDQYSRLIAIASVAGIEVNHETQKLTRPVIDLELRALLARYYFGNEMFYKVYNTSDKVIAKSLEILQ